MDEVKPRVISKIRAVIFDCYGTLVDVLTNEGKNEIFSQISQYLQYYGFDIDSAELKSLYNFQKKQYLNTSHEMYPEFDIEEVFRRILKMGGQNNPFLIESCCKLFRLISREHLQLFPDSLSSLKDLKEKGFPLVMLSNAQKVFFYDEIAWLKINHFFNYFVVSSVWGFRKPDQRLFAMACNLCNVLPGEAVYIGNDADVDIGGAHHIGMRAILIDRDQKQKNRQPWPDFYAINLNQAVEWIKETNELV